MDEIGSPRNDAQIVGSFPRLCGCANMLGQKDHLLGLVFYKKKEHWYPKDLGFKTEVSEELVEANDM